MKLMPVKISSTNPDVTSIKEYLAGYESAISIYNGDYTASWLLNGIHEKRWEIKTKRTVKKTNPNGEFEFQYTKSINWDRFMPDGTSLCDHCNSKVLRFYQKALFILIESNTLMPNTSSDSIHSIVRSMFNFIPWTFREDVGLNPKTDVLKRLTQKRLESYIADYIKGGIFKLTECAKIIIQKFNQLTDSSIDEINRFYFNEYEKEKIILFFKKYDLYKTNKSGLNHVDRNKLLSLCKLPTSMAYNDHLSLFLRQFEPDLMRENPYVLLPLNLEFELPGHTTPLIKDVENKPSDYRSGNNIIYLISEILKLKPLFPEYLPSAESFRFSKLLSYSKKNGSTGELTPWVPLPIFLFTLNKSIDFLITLGDSILNCIEEIYSALINEDLLVAHNKRKSYQDRRSNIIATVLSKYSSVLKVTKLYSNPVNGYLGVKYADQLRNDTNLYYLIKILKAACFIIIASLKPIRLNEITLLKRDCLYYKKNDGYWLVHNVEKAGINGVLPEGSKPIPFIAASAIKTLQRFNAHAQLICPSHKESKYLLYTLNYGSDGSKATVDSQEEIRSCLNIFCDYFETPTDTYGRRWYVNIHELRKSFLLNFFWVFKHSSLDACRWIAGHSNPEHVFHYIESNIPGEEMVEVEAEYAAQQLRLFRVDNKLSDIENIEQLYNNVCEHFKVKAITEVPSNELNEWLNYAIKSNKYEIYAYGIETDNPLYSATVAVKVT